MIKISFFILILSYFLYFYLFPLEKLQPEEFFLKDSLPSLSNNWKKNKELTKDIFHLNKHILLAPESIIIDSYSGVGYTSLSNGRVVAVNQEGNYLYDIFFVGGYIQSKIVVDNSSELYKWCHNQALSGELAWNCNGERLCGRPLGLRYVNILNHSLLFILDAYHGMFQYNISSKSIKHLFNNSKPISNLNNNENYSKPLFFNDFDVKVYKLTNSNQENQNDYDNFQFKFFITDSSYCYMRCQNRQLIIEGSSTGSLYLFDTFKSDTLQLLISKLHFPNGVQLLFDNNTLLFAESCRFRIIQVDIKKLLSYRNIQFHYFDYNLTFITNFDNLLLNSSISGVNIYLSSIPGFIDNIRSIPLNQLPPEINQYHQNKLIKQSESEESLQYLTISLGTLACKPFSLLHTIYQTIWLRKIIGAIIPMRYIEHLVPSYGLVGILDVNTGEIIYSYHDPTGQTSLISQATIHPITGDMWLGSHSNKFLALKRWEK